MQRYYELSKAISSGSLSIEPRNSLYWNGEKFDLDMLSVENALLHDANMDHLGAELVGLDLPGRGSFTVRDALFIVKAFKYFPILLKRAKEMGIDEL